MCPHTYNSAVTDNTALGHATQNNIQIVIHKLEVSMPGGRMSEEGKTLGSVFLQLLWPEGLPHQTEAIFRDTMTSHGPVGLNSLEDLRTNYFPMLGSLRDNWLESVRGYSQDRCTAIEALKPEGRDLLLDWLAQSNPDILLIDVNPDLHDSPWTIDFLLETRRIFEIAYLGNESISSAVTTHLCPRHETDKNYGPEIILQDLIVQIIEAHPKKFDYSTVAELCAAAHEPEELWKLITKCIRRAQIRTLVILIHEIEQRFLENCGKPSRNDFNFAGNLDKCIRSLHRDSGITVKTMVTSKLPEATYCFEGTGAVHITIDYPPYGCFCTDD